VSGVFINYRGEDSDTAAVLIDRELTARLGSDRVFLDSRSIPAGAEFAEELLGRLRACSVLVVVIGPRWLTLTDEAGERRIDDPRDWVRREIAEALARGLRVVPVLTGGAALPAEADLPADIAGLSSRQYLPLRHRYTRPDLAFLVERIAEADPEMAKVATERQSAMGRVPQQLPAAGRGFWTVRRPGWVVGGLTTLVVSLTVVLFRISAGADIANILTLLVAVVGLVVAGRGVVSRPSVDELVRTVAGGVLAERQRFRLQALGEEGDPRPADVTFRRPEERSERGLLVRWRDDGGAATGSLARIADYYAGLRRGRLVILGQPGAGKTVLATQLVIDLVRAMDDPSRPGGGAGRVPVWLSLPGCDLGDPAALRAADPAQTLARVNEWIATQISERYGLKLAQARAVVSAGRVLPVLDGLDEMDPAADPNVREAVWPRAAAVIDAFNSHDGPVVLACRVAEYTGLTGGAAARSGTGLLQDAQQVVLCPLDPEAVCDYLTYRFPGSDGGVEPRWRPVCERLRAEAGSPGTDASLAEVLGSPWRLFLAVTSYLEPGSRPAELLGHHPQTLHERLLAGLIPAVTHRSPTP